MKNQNKKVKKLELEIRELESKLAPYAIQDGSRATQECGGEEICPAPGSGAEGGAEC